MIEIDRFIIDEDAVDYIERIWNGGIKIHFCGGKKIELDEKNGPEFVKLYREAKSAKPETYMAEAKLSRTAYGDAYVSTLVAGWYDIRLGDIEHFVWMRDNHMPAHIRPEDLRFVLKS